MNFYCWKDTNLPFTYSSFPPVLAVIAGSAGSGKSTVCENVIKYLPEFSRVVTATTRPMRLGEVNGVHYHFLSPSDMKQRIAEGKMLEYAYVHGRNDERIYGTLESSIRLPLLEGRSLIMNIDVKGVATLRAKAAEIEYLRRAMVTVFLRVDMDALRKRLIARGQDSAAEIEVRMATFEQELAEAQKFDYVIEVGTRERVFAQMAQIIGMKQIQLVS